MKSRQEEEVNNVLRHKPITNAENIPSPLNLPRGVFRVHTALPPVTSPNKLPSSEKFTFMTGVKGVSECRGG